jgi:hypothetical protein
MTEERKAVATRELNIRWIAISSAVVYTPEMLPELLESQATDEIAVIYDEIRRFSGVPYVSSLQRYLATLPAALEWAWAAVRPAMVSGIIPETGWRLASDVRISPTEPISATMLQHWKVDADTLAVIRNIAANFVRVSPVNLVTGACLDLLLTGHMPAGTSLPPTDWMPPALLPPMPGNVDPAALPAKQRDVLLRFATDVGGTPFIPALYRQLAHFPPVLAWLADELVPRLQAPETAAARASFQAVARAAAADIVANLPPLAAPLPDQATTQRVRTAIARYAETSPEMTMFGQLILDALPEAVPR